MGYLFLKKVKGNFENKALLGRNLAESLTIVQVFIWKNKITINQEQIVCFHLRHNGN